MARFDDSAAFGQKYSSSESGQGTLFVCPFRLDPPRLFNEFLVGHFDVRLQPIAVLDFAYTLPFYRFTLWSHGVCSVTLI